MVLPADPEYEAAKDAWNKDIVGRPSAIARPANASEVAGVVRWAVACGAPMCIASGRHSVYASRSDTLMLDLSGLTQLDVDPVARIADVGPGIKLGPFDAACAAHGLATTAGTNPDTGVAGLSEFRRHYFSRRTAPPRSATWKRHSFFFLSLSFPIIMMTVGLPPVSAALGGGFGFLCRRHGLTIDNLLECEVVLLDGRIVVAKPEGEFEDLFWALRGGGGNFGVVTRFRYRLHPRGNVLIHTVRHGPPFNLQRALCAPRGF